MLRNNGFSLIELMITVAIISILAAVAVPSYSSYVRETNRAEALEELVTLVSRQEKNFAKHNRYTADLAELGYVAVASKFYTASDLYQLTLTTDTKGITFAIVASVNTSETQVNDEECYQFTITHTTSKTSKNKAGSASQCWP